MAIDKNSIIKEAQKYIAKGQFDKAIAEWKKLLKETPNDPNIHNTIGDLCLKKNSKSEAVVAYKKAADLLAADGFTSKAIALYKKCLNIDPKMMDAHLALGDLNADKGLTGNALENYKLVADYYTHQHQTAKALDIYQKMADLNPSNVAFQIKLGDMYAKEGMKEKSATAYLAAADVHVSKSAFKDARHLFEKVLALDPGNKQVYHKAGIVYFKEGKFIEACKALKPAFESDPSSKDLVDIYLEALDKAGKDIEVEQVIRKLLAEKPDNTGLREKLYNLYLAKKDFDKAFVEAGTLADGKIASGNAGEAEEIYKSFVASSPYFAPIRQKLAEFYISVNRPQDAAAELLQAAELFVTEGDLRNAKAVLTQAIEIAPDMSAARERLEQLQSAVTSAPPPEAEFTTAEEPIPATPSSVSSVVPEPGPTSVLEEPPHPTPVAEAPVSAKEDPAITEAFTEADVLIKYGLADKAVERIETLCSHFPEDPGIRIKLRELYREQGNLDKAVQHALLAVALYTKDGRKDRAGATLQETFEMAPDHPAVLSRLGKATVAPTVPEGEAREETPQPEGLPDWLDTVHASQPTPEEISAEPIAPQEPTQKGEIEFEGLDAGIPSLEDTASLETSPVSESPETGQQQAQEEPPFGEVPEVAEPPVIEEVSPLSGAPSESETTAKEQPSIEKEFAGELEKFAIAPAKETAEDKPRAEADIDEIWAEAEFYFQQGLFDEARKHYSQIVALAPGNQRAIDRLAELSREADETREFAKLTDAVEGLEGYVPPEATEGVLAASASDDEAVRALMQEIQQLKVQPAPSPPPQVAAGAVNRPIEPAKKTDEADFFDLGAELQREGAAAQQEKSSSEDFFDLAAELRDELSNVPIPARPAVPEEEQSLDDIFEEFKKGVEQQTAREDADTHYNLGVAYKEMGLLDDAIGEFMMTPEDEPKFAQSRYMLGLCYMEKGEYQDAIIEIRNALDYAESLGLDTENRIEIHYDLGLACQCAGDSSGAADEFQKVFDEDPGYRDTAAKLKELQKGDFISLEQLKDDIEKEISSKFHEEGVRVEREEKTRKNERVGK